MRYLPSCPGFLVKEKTARPQIAPRRLLFVYVRPADPGMPNLDRERRQSRRASWAGSNCLAMRTVGVGFDRHRLRLSHKNTRTSREPRVSNQLVRPIKRLIGETRGAESHPRVAEDSRVWIVDSGGVPGTANSGQSRETPIRRAAARIGNSSRVEDRRGRFHCAGQACRTAVAVRSTPNQNAGKRAQRFTRRLPSTRSGCRESAVAFGAV